MRIAATLAVLAAFAAAPGHAGTYRQVYKFQGAPDGANPTAGMILANGMLYGTTYHGGGGNYPGGDGTVFSINPTTGAEAVVHSFNGLKLGNLPQAGVIAVGQKLYGTTANGGTQACGEVCGTVFSMNPATGAETLVYDFLGAPDGRDPGALLNAGRMLYGTTISGGTAGDGTVFAVDAKSGAETVLHSFQGGNDGSAPYTGLIMVNGTLYGTTSAGGAAGFGTVFAVDPSTGAETVLHAFGGAPNDGATPMAGLLDVSGTLYGTNEFGGNTSCVSGCGTVFSIDPQSGTETVLHSFDYTDGMYPLGGLIKVGGKLYGTTSAGGTGGVGNNGVLFALDPATGKEKVLYAFAGSSDGMAPEGNLVDVGGTLYGTTSLGGLGREYTLGTVFAYTP
jgi:uncharacterized repeat protein (TIGR03803 family)